MGYMKSDFVVNGHTGAVPGRVAVESEAVWIHSNFLLFLLIMFSPYKTVKVLIHDIGLGQATGFSVLRSPLMPPGCPTHFAAGLCPLCTAFDKFVERSIGSLEVSGSMNVWPGLKLWEAHKSQLSGAADACDLRWRSDFHFIFVTNITPSLVCVSREAKLPETESM